MKDEFPFQNELVVLTLTMPRMTAALLMSPFFSDQFIQGLARQVVIISLTLVAVPIVAGAAGAAGPLDLGARGPLFFSGKAKKVSTPGTNRAKVPTESGSGISDRSSRKLHSTVFQP